MHTFTYDNHTSRRSGQMEWKQLYIPTLRSRITHYSHSGIPSQKPMFIQLENYCVQGIVESRF